MLGRIVHARWASEAHLRLHVDTLQVRVRDLEGAAIAKKGYVQEEIARSLARERDLWQRKREAHAIATKRERSWLQVEIGLICGHIGILIGKMRGHRMPAPHILGRDPSIRRHKLEYMPTPPRPAGTWGYAPLDDWAWGPALGYSPGSPADRVGAFIGPTMSNDGNDRSTRCFANDAIRDDDSP